MFRALCSALVLLFAAGAAQAQTCPDGPTVPGIDVSKWQGAIDWAQVAGDGVRFAVIRVNHGLEDIDERFDENWAGARDNGIIRGWYQYFLIDEDPVDQADLMLDRLKGRLAADDLVPVIDIEHDGTGDETPEEYIAAIWQWIDRVEAATGKKPLLYTYQYFWNTRINTDEFELAGYPLWFANYNVTCPTLPNTLTRWDFWQTSSTGSVAGITGNVDTNLFNGVEAEMSDLMMGPATCGDGYCTLDETSETCAADCEGCLAVPPEGRILDDKDACQAYGGAPESMRWDGINGYAGSLRWTWAWDNATEDVWAETTIRVEQSGSYAISVYTDANVAGSTQVPYAVTSESGLSAVTLDQTAQDGWAALGTFDFVAGETYTVRAQDNTGEAFGTMRKVVFDAVQVEPVTLIGGPDAGVTGPDAGDVADAGLDAGAGPDAAGGGPDAGAEGPDAGVVQDAGAPGDDAGEGEPEPQPPPSVVEGCTCVSGDAAAPPALALALLMLLLVRRREPL